MMRDPLRFGNFAYESTRDMAKGLTIKRERFCQKYLECGNASEAYRFAFASKRMSDKTVYEAASRLLKNSKVVARLDELKAQAAEVCDLKRDDVIRMLSEAVLADVTDYVSPNGTIRAADIQAMPKSKRRLIESIESTRAGVKIKLMGKNNSIERLAKMCGWDAPDKVEIDNRVEISVLNGVSVEKLKAIRDMING